MGCQTERRTVVQSAEREASIWGVAGPDGPEGVGVLARRDKPNEPAVARVPACGGVAETRLGRSGGAEARRDEGKK